MHQHGATYDVAVPFSKHHVKSDDAIQWEMVTLPEKDIIPPACAQLAEVTAMHLELAKQILMACTEMHGVGRPTCFPSE